jgi:hypothetical protein
MKRLLIGMIILAATSINAFSAEKRIECMTEGKNIHVAIVGSNENFDLVETLTIIKGGVFGKDLQVQHPNCKVIPRDSEKGLFVIVNCEDQNLLVNQFLAKESNGQATLKLGLKRHSLTCKTN